MVAKALVAVELDSGCHIQLTHKLNADGYYRRRLSSSRTNPKNIEMFHRTMWKHFNGEIPTGYEIDHLCKNRACFNIKHLRCIDGSLHASISNSERVIRKVNHETPNTD